MLFTEFNLEKAKEVWMEEAEERGKELGKELGREEGKLESKRLIAVSLFDVLDVETIAEKTGLTIEELKELKENRITE